MKPKHLLLIPLALLLIPTTGCNPPSKKGNSYADVCAIGCSDTLRERMRCVRIINSAANGRDNAGDHKAAQVLHGLESVLMSEDN